MYACSRTEKPSKVEITFERSVDTLVGFLNRFSPDSNRADNEDDPPLLVTNRYRPRFEDPTVWVATFYEIALFAPPSILARCLEREVGVLLAEGNQGEKLTVRTTYRLSHSPCMLMPSPVTVSLLST